MVTQAKNLYLEGQRPSEMDIDLKKKVDVFQGTNVLTMAEKRQYVKDNHFKTIITTDNPWTDPETGRVVLFEKQPREATRIP